MGRSTRYDSVGHLTQHVELARQNRPAANQYLALVPAAKAPGLATGKNGCHSHRAAHDSQIKTGTLAEK